MLYYSFRIDCAYAGEESLAMAFRKTRREGGEAVARLNAILCAAYEEGRYTFICCGNPGSWQMAAAFGEKDKVSVPFLREFLKTPLKEKGGVKEFSLSNLHEITAAEFQNDLEKADNLDFLDDCRRVIHNAHVDIFDNRQFKLREEIQEEAAMTKKDALARAREILADQSLLDELGRIYSAENVTSFHGHPVHYKITAGGQPSAMAIVRLLAGALHARGRLLGRRISIVSEITEDCYDESDMDNLFKNAAGTTVVIDLRGSNEAPANYASAYERVTQYIADKVRDHHHNVLCMFIEHTDNPGFAPSLIAKAEEHIGLIPISEGVGNRRNARAYLHRLVKEADFEVMDDKEIDEALREKHSYTTSELYRIYNSFYKGGLKNKLYRAYRKVEFATVKKEMIEGDAYERLQAMVGLDSVKAIVHQIIAAHKVEKMRREMGMARQSRSLHMMFTGNPGSAKTTVARLLAEILKKEGVLASGAYVECGRGDLVGKYVGWTAPTVSEKFRRARGGVLFIDEAYALVDDKDGLYGDEAINTIVQEMENHRDDVLVIFAGYKEKMKQFLARNEGLRSRIAFHVDFPDYNAGELTGILTLMAKDRGYTLGEASLEKCGDIFRAACRQKEFGNGRFVRNLLEQAVMKQSLRLMEKSDGQTVSREEIATLVPADFDVNVAECYAPEEARIGFV
ncbi:MAG: AAA family ATPase [Schwartzia sp.]|nr:AAA family ATPase [Schwartzia sp. (in: firmicutes)]